MQSTSTCYFCSCPCAGMYCCARCERADREINQLAAEVERLRWELSQAQRQFA